MGKLYNLTKFRNDIIEILNSLDLSVDINARVYSLTKFKGSDLPYDAHLDEFISEYNQLKSDSLVSFNSISSFVDQLTVDIDDLTIEMFNNEEYRNTFCEKNINQNTQQIFSTTEIDAHILSKITAYSDWHYPALQINPRCKKWVDGMVAADPLYLTSIDLNNIKEIISGYPELYQNRLRLYEIINRDFSKLPQNQFSFVLCWDNFNYLSMEKIEKYIQEVYDLLRPGGTFIFSFNNCDLLGPTVRAENLANSYCSARILRKIFAKVGFEVIEFQDIETDDAFYTHVSWVELKKSGTLHTVKAAQALGQILVK